MEQCAISKDLLTTPLTTKISATFFRSKQVIGLLMICSETRIGRIFQSPWHRLEITLLSTVFYSFQWNYFFYVFWLFVESADACFLSFFSSYCWLLQHKIKLIWWTTVISSTVYGYFSFCTDLLRLYEDLKKSSQQTSNLGRWLTQNHTSLCFNTYHGGQWLFAWTARDERWGDCTHKLTLDAKILATH